MTEIDALPDTYWAWVAGIIDGEGCYMIRISERHRPIANPTGRLDMSVRATVHVVNTDLRMLERLGDSGGSVRPQKRRAQPTHKPTSVWHAGAHWLRSHGPLILPYAVTKREHLCLVLGALNSDGLMRDSLEAIAPRITELNRRGARCSS